VALNNAPTALGQSLVTKPGRSLPIALGANDPDSDPLTYEIVEPPGQGSLEGSSTNYLYRPADGFLGRDRFSFRVSDGQTSSVPAFIEIVVVNTNSAPVAHGLFVEAKPNAVTEILLDASDGESDPLGYQITKRPDFGDLSGTPPKLHYTPKAGFIGFDRFAFRVSDGEVESGEAFVSIAIRSPNLPPVATNQTVTVVRDQPFLLTLLASDPDGDMLRAPILKGPKHGRLFGTGIMFTYAPAPGFTGEDSFTYKVWDGQAYSKEAKVSINVAATLPEDQLRFTKVELLTAGAIRMVLQTRAGVNYEVAVSSDFLNWEKLSAFKAEGVESTVLDSNENRPGMRFYRAHTVTNSPSSLLKN